MNILDALRTGQWGGDAGHNSGMNQAALTLGASLLGSQGKTFGQALGGGLLGAQQVYGSRTDAHADTEYKKALAQAAQQKALHDNLALEMDLAKWTRSQEQMAKMQPYIDNILRSKFGGIPGAAPAPQMPRVPTDMPADQMTPEQRALAGMGPATGPGVSQQAAPTQLAAGPGASGIGPVAGASGQPPPDVNGIYRPQQAPAMAQPTADVPDWQKEVNAYQGLSLIYTQTGDNEKAKRYKDLAESVMNANMPKDIGGYAYDPGTGAYTYRPKFPPGFGPNGIDPKYRAAVLKHTGDTTAIEEYGKRFYEEITYHDPRTGRMVKGLRGVVAPETLGPPPPAIPGFGATPAGGQPGAPVQQPMNLPGQYKPTAGQPATPPPGAVFSDESPDTTLEREERSGVRKQLREGFQSTQLKDALDSASIARGELSTYEAMRALLQYDKPGAESVLDNPNALKTGPFAQQLLFIGQTLDMLGVKGKELKQKISRMETFRAIANELQLNRQMLLKGQTSDRDMVTVEQSIPKLTNTPEGIAIMIDLMQTNAERRIEKAQFMHRYLATRPAEELPYAEDVWQKRINDPSYSIFAHPRMKKWIDSGHIKITPPKAA